MLPELPLRPKARLKAQRLMGGKSGSSASVAQRVCTSLTERALALSATGMKTRLPSASWPRRTSSLALFSTSVRAKKAFSRLASSKSIDFTWSRGMRRVPAKAVSMTTFSLRRRRMVPWMTSSVLVTMVSAWAHAAQKQSERAARVLRIVVGILGVVGVVFRVVKLGIGARDDEGDFALSCDRVPRRTRSWALVISRQTAASRSPKTSSAARRLAPMRKGDSRQTSVCGRARSCSKKRRNAPALRGGKPLKV